MTMPATCCSMAESGPGRFMLADGRVICSGLYTELRRRLRREAVEEDFTPISRLDGFVKAEIHHRYGKHCFLCEGEIVLHLQGAPLLRKLAPEDGKFSKCTDAYFHTDCWWRCQRDKANKRRRVRYADKETMGKQKEESVRAAKAANLAAKNAGTSPMNTGNEPKSKRPRKDEEPTRISKELSWCQP